MVMERRAAVPKRSICFDVSSRQYFSIGNKGGRNNVQFSGGTGAIRVIQKKGIEKGEEILMTYGKKYWRGKKKETQLEETKEQRMRGFVAYSDHGGG